MNQKLQRLSRIAKLRVIAFALYPEEHNEEDVAWLHKSTTQALLADDHEAYSRGEAPQNPVNLDKLKMLVGTKADPELDPELGSVIGKLIPAQHAQILATELQVRHGVIAGTACPSCVTKAKAKKA